VRLDGDDDDGLFSLIRCSLLLHVKIPHVTGCNFKIAEHTNHLSRIVSIQPSPCRAMHVPEPVASTHIRATVGVPVLQYRVPVNPNPNNRI
jgi:hypothetical protein